MPTIHRPVPLRMTFRTVLLVKDPPMPPKPLNPPADRRKPSLIPRFLYIPLSDLWARFLRSWILGLNRSGK